MKTMLLHIFAFFYVFVTKFKHYPRKGLIIISVLIGIFVSGCASGNTRIGLFSGFGIGSNGHISIGTSTTLQPGSATYEAIYGSGADVSKPLKDDISIGKMGYVIQVGAFSKADNAANLADSLEDKGLDPYYFKDDSGLYKVRFGNFSSESAAKKEAQKLQKSNMIEEFYIVSPASYTIAKAPATAGSRSSVRKELVASAKKYIGVPYKWGGNTTAGIDCSGLTQAVYSINGLSLPRNSRQQYSKGKGITKSNLQEGDLVFFATSGGRTVSHVGIYIGNDQFIHAPSKGKNVTTASLSNSYWIKAYVGGRSYI